MSSKDRIAWLITWEGPESEYNKRCKVVAILRYQNGNDRISWVLPILYQSENNHTLDEKMYFICRTGRDNCFRQEHWGDYPDFLYGDLGKNYLWARKVGNLRCEENANDCHQHTLYWTEFEKEKLNPKYGEAGPPSGEMDQASIRVSGKIDKSYTYSNRETVDEQVKSFFKSKSVA